MAATFVWKWGLDWAWSDGDTKLNNMRKKWQFGYFLSKELRVTKQTKGKWITPDLSKFFQPHHVIPFSNHGPEMKHIVKMHPCLHSYFLWGGGKL